MPVDMQIVKNGTAEAVRFPGHEEAARLGDLAQCIADALGTSMGRSAGSLFERLIGFVGYPDEFALWWDGFTCELGCSAPCRVDMDGIAERLVASGAFVLV